MITKICVHKRKIIFIANFYDRKALQSILNKDTIRGFPSNERDVSITFSKLGICFSLLFPTLTLFFPRISDYF